ncbi:MAG: site-specific DNA-methyltransferase [Moraxellaceae bacterium]|nr:site-specific DNA-methyltransferase [Moraxellaceae bacterium]
MSHYANLNQKLKNIFQIDRPDLDFGVYRILNSRQAEISDYLDNKLKKKVDEYLATANQSLASNQLATLAQQIKDEFGKRAFDDNDNLVNEEAINSDLGKQYTELSKKINGKLDQSTVFNHLYTFFSRYYDEGDFISQRRYKGDTYAIPYAGEEVMLHWANKDQYYTKSGEMFSNYRIRFTEQGHSDKSVIFRLLSADTAKDNQKDNDKDRRFVILTKPKTVTKTDEDGEAYQQTIEPIVINDNHTEMTIWFEYAVMNKGTKQDKLNLDAHKKIIGLVEDNYNDWLSLLITPAPTEKQPQRDLLLKHLNTFTQKNTADYFIHKNLGKFLSNELDFYIKNEVMQLDNIVNSDSFSDIENQLAIVKCLKQIGTELISFLASLEDFQKRLWLKKKFVVSSHYCITLERIFDCMDSEFFDEIIANNRQWQQWQALGLQTDSKDWQTLAYLKNNPYLMLDTSLYNEAFKAKLLNNIDDLDEQTDGVIIHSDNFQALNLLQEKYQEKVQCIYIDPPYNTSENSFYYKNSFKDSSWLAMIENRLSNSIKLVSNTGVVNCAIDDYEYSRLQSVMNYVIGEDNKLGNLVVEIKPSGRTNDFYLATSHEYSLIYAKDISKVEPINFSDLSDEQQKVYKFEDNKGRYKWRDFMRTGGFSTPDERPNSFYPIYYHESTGTISLEKKIEFIEVLPVDSTGSYRVWRKTKPSFQEHLDNKEIQIVKRSDNSFRVEITDRIKSGIRPKSVWVGSEYDASSHGTKLIQKMLPEVNFSFPKSINTTKNNISLSIKNNKKSLILDYFAGSGTTAHATIALNREDNGKRKYILVEQGEYFNTVIKPRIQKVVYSPDWKNGKPQLPKKITDENNPYQGISHCLKVLKLESYEV